MPDLFEHGNAYCPKCDKTIRIRWESENPRWMQRALLVAAEAHARESPECESTDLKINRYLEIP